MEEVCVLGTHLPERHAEHIYKKLVLETLVHLKQLSSIICTDKMNVWIVKQLTNFALCHGVTLSHPGYVEFSTAKFFQLIADEKKKIFITRHVILIHCTILVIRNKRPCVTLLCGLVAAPFLRRCNQFFKGACNVYFGVSSRKID